MGGRISGGEKKGCEKGKIVSLVSTHAVPMIKIEGFRSCLCVDWSAEIIHLN